MALPDTAERVGIVVELVLLNGVAVGPLLAMTLDPAQSFRLGLALLTVPGLVAGWLVATERVRVSYTQCFWFALVAGFGSSALYAALGYNQHPGSHEAARVVLWLVAALVGVLVADYESIAARLR